jgi:hypothetical protein
VNERLNPDFIDVPTILANQNILSRRLLWLFTLPFGLLPVWLTPGR